MELKLEGTDTLIAASVVDSTRKDTSPIVRSKPKPLDLDPSVYLRNDYVVVDFETTNLDHGNPATKANRIVFAAWFLGEGHPAAQLRRGGTGRVYSQFGNEFEQQRLLDAIASASFVVAYNAKFECGWLKRCGIELRDLIVYDPMLGEYVLAGNRKFEGGLSLESTLKRYSIPGKMRYVSELIGGGVCPSEIPPSELEAYGKCDVTRTESLFLQQRRSIFGMGLEAVLYGRCLQSPMLADIESRGVYLDKERVYSQYRSSIHDFEGCTESLSAFCGEVNWNSPKQVGELLYDRLGFEELKDYRGKLVRTATGNRSASDPTISQLQGNTASQRQFLKLWGTLAPLKKEVSILETMKGVCDEDDGHFFASFNQAIAQNHRLTSSGKKWGLQLQNQPRSFKRLFRSGRPGCRVAEGDCPQLEFRTAIDLTGDPVGQADILARADIHSLTSSVTGFTRQESKPHTFKPVYGGTSGPPRLRRYYDAFNRRYCVLHEGQMGWVYSVLEHKQLRIASGLVFYWPDTEKVRSGYIKNTPAIFNYPVSSFATADISQLSLLLTWHGIRGLDTFICNTIHDSGVADVPAEEACKFERIMVQSYTDEIYDVLERLYDYRFRLPLGLGFKCGEFWGAGEERKYEPESRFKFTSDTQTTINLQ